MEVLTPKQKIVLKAIKDYHFRYGKMPTLRELKDFLAQNYNLTFKSLRSVFQYLEKLEKKGLIKRGQGPREIKLLDLKEVNFWHIPIYGWINAGDACCFPQEAIEGYLKISKNLLLVKNKNLFAIEVVGDSMNLAKVRGKSIEEGDYLLVNPDDKNFVNGDIVVVNVDGALTVKEFRWIDKNTIGLFPRSTNKEHKPIYLTKKDDFLIIGKVVDVYKHNN